MQLDEKKQVSLSETTRPASSERRGEPFSEWLEQHGDLLFKFARLRVGDANLAEDLVQETFFKAIRGYQNFRGEASVRTWLFTILKNEINGYFRSASRRKQEATSDPFDLGKLLHPEVASSEFSTNLEKDEFWVAVQRCFEKVPEHLLETFLFRLANPDETIENLCKELDLSPSNFSVRLFRTRLLLRKCLERSWLS